MKKILLVLLILFIATNLYALTDRERIEIAHHLKVQTQITKDVQELLIDWAEYRINTDLALKKLRHWKTKYNRLIDPTPEMKKTYDLYNKFLTQTKDILIDMEETGGENNSYLQIKAIETSKEMEEEVTRVKYLLK